jgi:hypothetical protein
MPDVSRKDKDVPHKKMNPQSMLDSMFLIDMIHPEDTE